MNGGSGSIFGGITIFVICVGVGGIIYQLNANSGKGVASDVTSLGNTSLTNLYK